MSPHLVHPIATIGALFFATVLLHRLAGLRAALLIAFVTLGLVAGVHDLGVNARIDALLKESSTSFRTVTVPLESAWHATPTGYRIAASRFFSEGKTIRRPITIYASALPPGGRSAKNLTAEGFLGRSERGRLFLSCKSPRLIRYEGKASPFHPRYWNRRTDGKLAELAARHPTYLRPIALAKALALGRSDDLPSALREDYRRGGTYHLLVFSGMQIALAAAAVSFVFRRRGQPAMVDWALLVLSIAGPLFAGMDPSVTRASLMIGIYAASRLLGRPTSIENLFFISVFARLLLYPSELTDPGFALTHAAAGGLLFIGQPLARLTKRRIPSMFLYGAGAEAATMPLTLLFFHQIVLGGSIVTVVLAPILAIMLGLAAAVCGLVFAGDAAALLTLDILDALDRVATAINHFSGTTLRLSRMGLAPPASLVAASFIAFLLLDLRHRRLSNAAVLFLPLFASLAISISKRSVDAPQVEFLDVGQGDAILVRSSTRVMLVDSGGRRDDPEFGRRVLLPRLLDRGVRRIDIVLLTHPHPDHCGGLVTVIDTLAVSSVWISAAHAREPCAVDLLQAATRRQIAVRLINSREMRSASTLGEFVIQGQLARSRFKRASLNNGSIVCRLTSRKRSLLLTGDIEKEAEHDLIASGAIRPAEVLKVAHHGSRNSTTDEFVTAATPKIAVISCGRRNPFGHPHPSVVKRLNSSGIRVYTTQNNGDVRIVLRNRGLFVNTQIDTPLSPP